MKFGPLDVAFQTHAGRARDNNEDACRLPDADPALLQQRGYLFALADGIGGYGGGRDASLTTLTTLYEQFYGTPTSTLQHAIQMANMAVRRLSMQPGRDTRMGSTLVAALFEHQHIVVAHVGDSRAYLVHQGDIQQVTTDHVRLKGAANTPLQEKFVITRSIGSESTTEPDFTTLPHTQPHDAIVLCSDGLSNLVEAFEIAHAVTTHTPDTAARMLVAMANERGGFDNITVVIMRIETLPFTKPDEDLL